ncbi:MAG: ABC transporter permease [Bacillota bacterium]
MLRYTGKRLFISLITIWILITLTFFLVRLLPGDPFTTQRMTPEIRANLEKYYGFDKPLPVQYLKYLGNLAKLDLGISMRYKGRSVNGILADAFPVSANLGMRAVIFAATTGVILGIIAALNKDKILDKLTIFIAIVGVSIPNFVMASFLQYIFGVKLKWLPVAQWMDPSRGMGIEHTILPVLCLGFGTLATYSRYMRASMLEVTTSEYVKTAKAKGLSPLQVTVRHQIRNALLPIVTLLGVTIAVLLTGTFVVETVFAIPGMGRQYVLSIAVRDYPMILGLTTFYGTFLIFMTFLTDIIYGLVDPRIRVSK